MKVGDYVRTENGEIGTIIDCPEQLKKDYGKWLWFETIEEQRPIRREQIEKSSPNIIDIIEAGDYVNGKKVIDTYTDYIFDYTEAFKVIRFSETDILHDVRHIKSIVTKEMFANAEYRVETD